MRTRKFILAKLIIILFPLFSAAQYAENARELFSEGEFFFNRDEYPEAVFYYRELLKIYPDNANFNFKAGECYLNMPGSEHQAIPHLEKAVQNIVPRNRYKGKIFDESAAPLHALFYLGNAYRIGNRLSDALEVYNRFVNSPFYYGNYNISIVDNEIMSCERAKIIQDKPLDVTETMLGNEINTSFSETHPVVSADELAIAFVRRLQFYNALFVSLYNNGEWGEPVNITPQTGSDGDMYPACFSSDNKELYLIKTDKKSSDIYISRYIGNSWTKAEKIRGRVNSKRDETSAWLSEDGNTLYFSSNRTGGRGGFDIYQALKDDEGGWSDVRNVGRTVNTRFDEAFPCISIDNDTLYFSSKGHFNMGGYDTFYSVRITDGWSLPVNIGYPLNNTGDNAGFVIVGRDKVYFSKPNQEMPTQEDIFVIFIHGK